MYMCDLCDIFPILLKTNALQVKIISYIFAKQLL